MKFKTLLFAAFILVSGMVGKASAVLYFSVSANPFVTPGYGDNTNLSTSGTVEYTISHLTGSNQALNFLQLQFESAVFSSFTFLSALIDGSTSVGFSPSGDLLQSSAFSMAPGSSMVLRVAYTFAGGLPATASSAAALTWLEGGMWQQNSAGFSSSPSFAIYGGSSSLAPEPGTVLLLGSGLLGLGIVNRIRQKRKMLS